MTSAADAHTTAKSTSCGYALLLIQHGVGPAHELRQALVARVHAALPACSVRWHSNRMLAVDVPYPFQGSIDRLERVCRDMAEGWWVPGEQRRATVLCGAASTKIANQVRSERAYQALATAISRRDLVPVVADSIKPERRLPSWLGFFTTTSAQIALPYIVGWVGILTLLMLGAAVGIDLSGPMYLVVSAAMLLMALIQVAECIHALAPTQPPQMSDEFPPASAIIAAYLPNEADTIEETVWNFLHHHYPAGLQVILAYNSPHPLPVEDRLRLWASRFPNLVLLKVEGSTSKAQNVNTALDIVTGDFVGIFDADHKPAPGSFFRAAKWLQTHDVVQGHCVVRNADESFTSDVIAREFEAIYAVSHPGRARTYNFGIFGGSNGYWRTSALRRTRFQMTMLTEDIDSAIRGVTAGLRITNDPGLVSFELAPTSVGMLWKQRNRWAQGWFQVSIKRLRVALKTPRLAFKQKVGMVMLLLWTQIAPWISFSVLPIVVFGLTHPAHRIWFIPASLAASALGLLSVVLPVWTAYKLSHPLVRDKRAFIGYTFLVMFVYAEFKNASVRTSHLRHILGLNEWVVTPRKTTKPAPQAAAAAAEVVHERT